MTRNSNNLAHECASALSCLQRAVSFTMRRGAVCAPYSYSAISARAESIVGDAEQNNGSNSSIFGSAVPFSVAHTIVLADCHLSAYRQGK
ncbi:hypothetical protein GGF39_002968 [Coemansia sp. RSA 1721]|nr:hypothetical protein GGF39_002968 [Coemansia sp. RSA 1721]